MQINIRVKINLFTFQVTLIRQNSIDAFGANSDDLDGVMFKVVSHPETEKASKPEMTLKPEMTVKEEKVDVTEPIKEEEK